MYMSMHPRIYMYASSLFRAEYRSCVRWYVTVAYFLACVTPNPVLLLFTLCFPMKKYVNTETNLLVCVSSYLYTV